MASEKDIHFILVKEIEKRPLIYNYTLPGYNSKAGSEKAWKEVASIANLPVHDCKEKWRNIRSTYSRSIKPLPRRNKKPYYLSEHLTFILPYIKKQKRALNRDNHDNASPEPDDNSYNIEFEQSDDCEDSSDSKYLINITPGPSPSTSQMDASRRRTLPFEDYEPPFSKMKFEEKEILNKTQEQMNFFFMSILPEFENMDGQQIRTFKIKCLQLIDDMKQSVPSSSSAKIQSDSTS